MPGENGNHIDDTFPPEAVEALRQGNRIQAIKILVLKRKLSLDAATEILDEYVAGNPRLARKLRSEIVHVGQRQSLRVIIAVVIVTFLFFWFFRA